MLVSKSLQESCPGLKRRSDTEEGKCFNVGGDLFGEKPERTEVGPFDKLFVSVECRAAAARRQRAALCSASAHKYVSYCSFKG